MLITAIDTETTGIIGKDYMAPNAPHIASITAIIYDTEKARVQASFNTMILPEDWEMPPAAEEVNGLSTELLSTYGIPLRDALIVFSQLVEPTDLIVAHNAPFDARMVASGLYRTDLLDELDSWLNKETYCTMKESKDIVQAKGKTGRLKNPKLTEAYEYFFERPLDNSHSANADAVGCLEIYLAIQATSGNEEEVSL